MTNNLFKTSHRLKSFARLDHARVLRKGFPEVVLAEHKTVSQIISIIRELYQHHRTVLITRLEEKKFKSLKSKFPKLQFHKQARIAWIGRVAQNGKKLHPVAVVTAGTSDIAVAEEAAMTLEWLGHPVKRFYDCGVAGLERIIQIVPQLNSAKIVICAAGMDGVLPSVLGGLIQKPIVAIPTNIGYGAHFKGLSSLLTMLNSCSQGVAVVNIDNGFGAACFAHLAAS